MSAFNLSSLAAMQDEHLEQASVHFWRCQLTAEKPRYAWDPYCGSGGKAKDNGDEKLPAAEDKTDDCEEDDEDDNDDDDDAVTVRHLLQVTGCVLPPQATGVHLITVRTSCYQPQQHHQLDQKPPVVSTRPACPIVCIDPLVQRTLALGHEFVLGCSGSSNDDAPVPVVFELAEGSGPVWLTGTHRVHRVTTRPLLPRYCDYDNEEDAEDATGDEVEDEEEDVEDVSDAKEAGEEDEAEGDDEEEEEEEEEEEKAKAKRPPVSNGKAIKGQAGVKMKLAAGKKKSQDGAEQQEQQRRKRSKPDS